MSEQRAPSAWEAYQPHLIELKRRLRIALVAYFAGAFALMSVADRLYAWLARPLVEALPQGSSLVFIGVPDVFFSYLKLSLVASLFLTSPITLYQLWAFIAPGLYQHERRMFLFVLTASVGLLVLGAAFAYFAVFPLVFRFFVGLAGDAIQAMPAVREYLSFALKMMFAFGLAFELPLMLMLAARAGLLNPDALARKRRFVVLWVFVLAALLTPPDVTSQVLLAVPTLLLFEIGLVLARLAARRAEAAKEGE